MKDYKPTRYIFDGDVDKAKTIVGDGNRLLFQLKNIQQAGAPDIKHLENKYSNGVVVMADTSIYGIDLVRIFVPPVFFEQKRSQRNFPIPVIGATDSIDNGYLIGAYVAQNFIGFNTEYVPIDESGNIVYTDKTVDGSTVSLIKLEVVGEHGLDDYIDGDRSKEVNWSLSQYNEDANTPESSCGEGMSICCRQDTAPLSIPMPPVQNAIGNCSGNITIGGILNSGGSNFDYLGSSSNGHDGLCYVLNYFCGYYCCSSIAICGDESNEIQVVNIGYGAPGCDSVIISGNSSASGSYGINLLSYFTKMFSFEASGSGNVTIAANSLEYENNHTEVGDYGWVLDSSVWADTDSWILIWAHEEYESDLSCSGDGLNGRLSVSSVPIIAGAYPCPSNNPYTDSIYVASKDGEWLIVELSCDDDNRPSYEGYVEIFDYNGSPFYMYKVIYGYSSENSFTHEYGCIYSGEIYRLKFISDNDYTHDFLSATYVGNDSSEQTITFPSEMSTMYNATGEYNNWDNYQNLRAGAYTIKS